MKKKSCAVAGALMLGCVPTLAADLGRAPAYKAPPAPVVLQSWTGCYVGGNLGGGWTEGDGFNAAGVQQGSASFSGFVGGGQVGCDYQFAGNWVLGIQGMFDGSALSTNSAFAGFIGSGKVDWFATVTGRLGYAVAPSVLLYAKGGAAFTHDQATATGAINATTSASPSGWTVGGGAEWMFAPRWSVFAEYNYLDFGRTNITFSNGIAASFTQNIQNALVGVNYHFYP